MEEEAILFTTLPESCMFTFIGDPEQPTGSATSHFAQLVIQKIACCRPGLRSTHITFRAENEYINNYLLFFDRAPSADDSPVSSDLLFQSLLNPLFDNTTRHEWTNFHKIGWEGIGGFVIPYCVRCHDLNALLWSLPTYHSLFRGPSSNQEVCGFLSPVTILNNTERLLLQPQSTADGHSKRRANLSPSSQSQQKRNTVLATDVMPKTTTDALKRFTEPHKHIHALFPTSLIEWNNPSAKSSSRDSAWLKDVECIVTTMIAFILQNTGFSNAETRSSKIGIFTLWLKVTKHLQSYFSLSQWKDHKNIGENPWTYLEEYLGHNWKLETLETIARHIANHPHQIRSILHIQTSITSASTTVTHALVIIPRHTKFTSNWA
jgi:hypothetical protein